MLYNQGKLIVIEGGDGSGKGTQSALLFKALKKVRPITFFDFPRYKQSVFGKLIRRSLAGEFGDFLNLSPYLSSLPYVLDRARAKYLLLEALKEGDVICDRYTTSNIAHQAAKLPDKEKQAFVDFIEQGEYGELGLPAPDLVIYLWLPTETSQELMKNRIKKGGERRSLDQFERRVDYQKKVADMYLHLAHSNDNWQVIDCLNSKKKLKNRQEIHREILQIVEKKLKIKA
jgi:dTMP kinase